ncbi:hypothetical protein FGF1_30750 [Flavobacteriaceae bacterium GF1]
MINLDDRIRSFKNLRGLINSRKLLGYKLNQLAKFNYEREGSTLFNLRDYHGFEFKTTNTNFIHLLTNETKSILIKWWSENNETLQNL